MITRDVKQLLVVPAFVHAQRFRACDAGSNVATCTCAGGSTAAGSCSWFPGFIIDRLGLRESYRSVLIAPNVYGDINVSDENARIFFQGISVGLQHTCTTGGTFADYSTGDWIEKVGLWRQTTATSTAPTPARLYTAVQYDAADVLGEVMATTSSTSAGAPSTSTGQSYYVGPSAAFDLGGAKRYIRCMLKPIIDTTACGALGLQMSATAIFGEPDLARPNEAEVKRILVTTPCAT